MRTVGVSMALVWTMGCASGPLGLSVEVDEDHPSVVHVDFSTGSRGDSWVTFALEERPEEFVHTTPKITGERKHEHLLVGLKAGQTYTYEVTFERSSGGRTVQSGTVATSEPPSILPVLTAETVDASRSQVYGKHVMFAASDESGGGGYSGDNNFFIGIADHEGDWVWWHELPTGRGTVNGQPSLDGQSLIWTEYDETRVDPEARIVRMTLDGEVLSETRADWAHHATVELPGGRFAYLGRSFTDMGVNDRGQVAMADTIVLTEEGSQEPGTVFFDYWEDWFGGLDGYPVEDGYVRCPNLFNELYSTAMVCESTHSNSLAYLEEQNAFYVYARVLSALIRVDATTGEIEGQLGGGDASDASLPNNELGSKGHFSHIWPGGMVLFDNGTGYEPPVSSIVEFSWTPNTVDQRWRYADPDGGYTNSLGDVRKLTGGNYLSSWMDLRKITEVTPERDEAWRMATDARPRRIYLLEDLYDLTKIGAVSP